MSITADAKQDHLKSKRTVKQLEFGHGSPSTMEFQVLWVNCFTAFREHTLKKSRQEPFTRDDIVRPFDIMIDKIKSTLKVKPTVSTEDSNKKGILGLIAQYGTFTYKPATGYRLTAQDSMRMQTWVNDAVKSGRLVHGK
ncbi:hypothetical protein MMC22_006459 [Lobaria immixta]|nr:hypothetical protein [Lobaria immixta]